MNKDFSASNSGKTATATAAGSTPFDQIKSLETAEEERVRRELAVFDRERNEVAKSAAEEEKQAEEEAREAARIELREFKEREMTRLVKKAEEEAHSGCHKLEEGCKKRQPAIVHSLVEQAINPSFFDPTA